MNNRADGSLERFTNDQLAVLEMAAAELSELLHGRADVFLYAHNAAHGDAAAAAAAASASSQSMMRRPFVAVTSPPRLINSCDITTPFTVELLNLILSQNVARAVSFYRIPYIEITLSMHLALSMLCKPVRVLVEVPRGGRNKKLRLLTAADTTLHCHERVAFAIAMRDVPRAARMLFRVFALRKPRPDHYDEQAELEAEAKKKKKKSGGHGGGGHHSGNKKEKEQAELLKADSFLLGWAATPVYDFKGCVDAMADVRLFERDFGLVDDDHDGDDGDGKNHGGKSQQLVSQCGGDDLAGDYKHNLSDPYFMAMQTQLQNEADTSSTSLSAVLSANIVLNDDDDGHEEKFTGVTKVVHSMPTRRVPMDVTQSAAQSAEPLSDKTLSILNEILRLSFNPMSSSLLTAASKEFIWSHRYHLLDKPELLPAFVMSVKWSDCERVQELYDLLDLWQSPGPVTALQLLDRRFMDPKVCCMYCMLYMFCSFFDVYYVCWN